MPNGTRILSLFIALVKVCMCGLKSAAIAVDLLFVCLVCG